MNFFQKDLQKLEPVQRKITAINERKPSTIWLFGPTSSGKTTIAMALLEMIRDMGEKAILYDGDEIRELFHHDFGFSETNRLKVVSTLVHFANKTTKAGVFAIVSALTANQSARDSMRRDIECLVDVYLDCPISTCIKRDPKGIYQKAIAGDIDTVIGYNSPYLKSKKACLTINTSAISVNKAARRIKNYLELKWEGS